MPKVGFSQLFAFGAGVAVGANWPRASSFVGFILQRLGFELTDLAIWMWDPEKSAARSPETASVAGPDAKKRTQAPLTEAGHPARKKTRAKARETARSPGIQSDAAIDRGIRRKTTDASEPWIRPDRDSNGAAADLKVMRNSRVIQSAINRKRAARVRAGGPKSKSAAVKSRRKTPVARPGGKSKIFPAAVLPADAALN